MLTVFKQTIEIVFTSYLLPALLLPVIWTVQRLTRRGGTKVSDDAPRVTRRLMRGYAAISGFLIVSWLLIRVGLPLEAIERPLAVLVWIAFAAMNFTFAALATSITTHYGSLAAGEEKDSLFLRFLALVLMQPLATAAAFFVLYRLMHLSFPQVFPWLDPSQEGI